MPRFFVLALLGACISLPSPRLWAQQQTNLGRYWGPATLYNPAAPEPTFLTLGYNLSATGQYGAALTETEKRPRAYNARVSYLDDRPTRQRVRLLVRGQFVSDNIGLSGHRAASAGAGVLISRRPERSGLSLALNVGYFDYHAQGSRLFVESSSDNEPIEIPNFSDQMGDVGIGAYYYHRLGRKRMIHGGMAMSQLGAAVLIEEEGETRVERSPRFFGSLGYIHFYDELSFLEMEATVKYSEFTTPRAGFNLRYQTNASPYLGAGLTSAGQVVMQVGLSLLPFYEQDRMVQVGYAFEYDFNENGPRDVGTHHLRASILLDY